MDGTLESSGREDGLQVEDVKSDGACADVSSTNTNRATLAPSQTQYVKLAHSLEREGKRKVEKGEI